ncbi:hypothetical protein [Rosistilla oblonga]|uniref:hypothetical protein n=1 Tax=Rosistilla oblonga TaxID=2527990 RepID=UPI003A971166
MPQFPEPLQISPRISVIPIIHGSGDFSWEVRRRMLEHEFDCVAIPLPHSFQQRVEEGVLQLPKPSIVIQPTSPRFTESEWSESQSADDDEDDFDDESPTSYVPIDPCQPVIMAIRIAMGEHLPRHFIDLETDPFEPMSATMPDPFALKRVPLERFAAAMLPGVPHPPDRQIQQRILHMALRLRELEQRYEKILFVCSVLQWPWVRQAYRESDAEMPEHDLVEPPEIYDVNPRSLNFMFGELPYITGLYERARAELEDDRFMSIDGVKQLLLAARDAYRADLGVRARKVTPLLLSQCLKYIRNLSLIGRRMTPDLYTIVVAAKQILGPQFALHVVETARSYPYLNSDSNNDRNQVTLGIDQARLPDGQIVPLVNRLPGPEVSWQTLQLNRRPTQEESKRWQYRWNPYGQCSYPPEDQQIENFRTRVVERAQAILGTDLARTEKFTTSVKDGIDIRDTLRHWYEKQIYVKVLPPDRGKLDCCVMLFDSPSDPRDYPWRTTWFAEHEEESTLAFYATDFSKEMVGPGIGMSVYGGAMFLFPPVVIPDIWNDPRLDFVDSLEERLIAAACTYSRSRQIAIMSSLPPGAGWRRLAKRFHKHLVHVPIGSFSDSHIQQLRMVHVLNGQHIRSYAADFIRKA